MPLGHVCYVVSPHLALQLTSRAAVEVESREPRFQRPTARHPVGNIVSTQSNRGLVPRTNSKLKGLFKLD